MKTHLDLERLEVSIMCFLSSRGNSNIGVRDGPIQCLGSGCQFVMLVGGLRKPSKVKFHAERRSPAQGLESNTSMPRGQNFLALWCDSVRNERIKSLKAMIILVFEGNDYTSIVTGLAMNQSQGLLK